MGLEGAGCNKVPDRQAVWRRDDYLIGHRRWLAPLPLHILYQRHLSPQLSSQVHKKALLNGSRLVSSEQQRGVCRFWALTAPSPMRAVWETSRWEAQSLVRTEDAEMRGPRCILGSSVHIFQPFPLKMWRLETLAPATTILRYAQLQQRGKQGSDLKFEEKQFIKSVCFQNSNILILNPSVEVACGAELGRREGWQAKLKDFPHWL